MPVNRIQASTLAERPSIKLFIDDMMVGEGFSSSMIAYIIGTYGGPADVITGCLAGPHEELWDDVCDLL